MGNNSILDKILTTKQAEEISKFNPPEILNSLFNVLNEREKEVLSRRFGLGGKKKETLGKIGKSLEVTRERVRQIEASSIKKIKAVQDFASKIKGVKSVINQLLEENGGILEEKSFLQKLLFLTEDNPANRAIILFIVQHILSDFLQKAEIAEELRLSWKLRLTSLDLIKKVIEEGLNIFKTKSRVLEKKELLSKFKESDFYKSHEAELADEYILSYLETSEKIRENSFGQWGLASWGIINLKRMSDKIYLILKKHGQPLHFTKIADMINKAKFDNKIAYPPTVHNELILDKKYVLIGRGIYALAEWGYKPGVVSEVIIDILKENNGPLNRKEIVKKVFDRRQVNESTIHLALTNKEKFKKLPSGEYTLVGND